MNTNALEALNKKSLHFFHVNLNSLLPKIELKCVANKTKAAIIGLTESKLEHAIPDIEVNFPWYDILQCDRNANSGGIACCIRKDVCFNRIYILIALHCKEI